MFQTYCIISIRAHVILIWIRICVRGAGNGGMSKNGIFCQQILSLPFTISADISIVCQKKSFPQGSWSFMNSLRISMNWIFKDVWFTLCCSRKLQALFVDQTYNIVFYSQQLFGPSDTFLFRRPSFLSLVHSNLVTFLQEGGLIFSQFCILS